MDDNFMERLDNIQDLHRMLDTVTNQKQDQIISGQEEVYDVVRHDNMQFKPKMVKNLKLLKMFMRF